MTEPAAVEHSCDQPEALAFEGSAWTCPECGTIYEVHSDWWYDDEGGGEHWSAWWQEADE